MSVCEVFTVDKRNTKTRIAYVKSIQNEILLHKTTLVKLLSGQRPKGCMREWKTIEFRRWPRDSVAGTDGGNDVCGGKKADRTMGSADTQKQNRRFQTELRS